MFFREGDFSPFISQTYVAFEQAYVYVVVDTTVYIVEPDSGKWSVVTTIDSKYQKNRRIDYSTVASNNKLYIFNNDPLGVLIVDLNQGDSKEILFYDKNNMTIHQSFLPTVVLCDERFYIIPVKEEELVIFHVDTQQYDVLVEWNNLLRRHLMEKGAIHCLVRYHNVAILGNNIVMSVYTDKGDYLVFFDLDCKSLQNIIPGDTNCRYFGLTSYESILIYQAYDGKKRIIERYDIIKNKKTQYIMDENTKCKSWLSVFDNRVATFFEDGRVHLIDFSTMEEKKPLISYGFLQGINQQNSDGRVALIGDKQIVIWDYCWAEYRNLIIPWTELFVRKIL